MRQIAVIGSSQATEEEYSIAYKLGKEFAKLGLVVVCGGRTGVMEAVCKGAKEEGGLTVGILPSYDGHEANSYVDIKINTGLSWNRNPLVVASGDMVVAIGGNYGTLSEIAYALILGKYVIGYKTHKVEGIELIDSVEEIVKRVRNFFEGNS
ncbi:MAG TPA: TIGR00725 family protein [Aquifex aeolicus]|nr:TIGR00725 family protein [Aquificaceae bacterium]HIP43403.1 TIGR00725 family protein [Aquifex aeolicus]